MQKELDELHGVLTKLTSTALGRRAFLASVPFLLTACATSQHRGREGDNSGQQTSLTVDDEKKMTAEVLPQMQKEYPPLNNPEMQNYVSEMGNQIVRANGLAGNPYHYSFTVVGVPYVNAFALPAGTVFVTAPLIDLADSEAELAGVIGHEIGHVKARHSAERMDTAKREQKKSWLYGIGGGLLGGAAGFGVGKLLCPPTDRTCLVKASALGAAAGAGGGLLIQKFAFMANSREDEMEADRIGFRTSVRAGYSKDHVGRFYSKLLKMEEQHKSGGAPLMSSVADALSTHPPSRERVAQMQQMSGESTQGANGRVSSKQFDRVRSLASEWTRAHKKA